MAQDCRQFGVLPRVGGWADQDPVELAAMRVALTAEAVFGKQARGENWTEQEADFVAWTVEDESG